MTKKQMSQAERAHVTGGVLQDVLEERVRQDAKWGVQDHPDGTAPALLAASLADRLRQECDRADGEGVTTWRHILAEEWAEALAALADGDVKGLREELVQVAGVAVAWIECIDRREV